MDPSVNNQEIMDALKEFESKQGNVPVPRPTDTVDVLQSQRLVVPQAPETSAMVRLVMKLSGGMIKDENQAQYVLLAFVIAALGASFYLFFG